MTAMWRASTRVKKPEHDQPAILDPIEADEML
jgi:hypothetical protein